MFGINEMATAVQHRINLVAIVFNNRSFGNVLRDQTNNFGGRFIGSSLVNPDFVKLAESFGAIGYRATNPAELKTTLERALADQAPVLIEVPGEPGAEVSPWPFIHP
jgi:acetolactate synthase I/II/III large subunit